MTESKYIYIVGATHSGSTLLGLILGSHSMITSVGETIALRSFIRGDFLCGCREPMASCRFWQEVFRELGQSKDSTRHTLHNFEIDVFASFKDTGLVGSLARRTICLELAAPRPALSGFNHLIFRRRYREALAAVENNFLLFDAVCRTSRKRLVVDSSKDPSRMKFLFMRRPQQSRVIYLVRDGRSYVESEMRRKKFTAERCSSRWVRANEKAMAMLKDVPRLQQITVKYEDLCDAPAKTIATICEFSGVDYEPNMLDFREGETHIVRGNIMRFSNVGEIRKDEGWRHRLHERELASFEQIAGSTARRLGYQV